uniref:Protein kinase n=1 Tax=Rhizophora mucronata TaxID=61149 RepID=A0A2P2LPF3_RHIMU
MFKAACSALTELSRGPNKSGGSQKNKRRKIKKEAKGLLSQEIFLIPKISRSAKKGKLYLMVQITMSSLNKFGGHSNWHRSGNNECSPCFGANSMLSLSSFRVSLQNMMRFSK